MDLVDVDVVDLDFFVFCSLYFVGLYCMYSLGNSKVVCIYFLVCIPV